MKRRLPRLPTLPPRALRERLGPVLLAAVYLLATHFPLGVAYAAPGVFFQQGAGATRLPLEVSSFDAPGFGEIEDAINLATGSLYLGTDALSNNSTLEAGDEQQGKFSGNWNFSQKLRLYGYKQDLLSGATPLPPATLANASFELPSMAAQPNGFQYAPSGASWTFSPVGAALQRNGSAWGAAVAPEGTQTAVIQGRGSLAQSVTFPAGRYRLKFQAARRAGQRQPLQFSVDGVMVGAPITPSSDSFAEYLTEGVELAAGSHTLKLEGTDATGDQSSFVDSLSLESTSLSGLATPTGLLESGTSGAQGHFYRIDGTTGGCGSVMASGFLRLGNLAPGRYRASLRARTTSSTPLPLAYGLTDGLMVGQTLSNVWKTYQQDFDVASTTDRVFQVRRDGPSADFDVGDLSVRRIGDLGGVGADLSGPNLIAEQDLLNPYWSPYCAAPNIRKLPTPWTVTPESSPLETLPSTDLASGTWAGFGLKPPVLPQHSLASADNPAPGSGGGGTGLTGASYPGSLNAGTYVVEFDARIDASGPFEGLTIRYGLNEATARDATLYSSWQSFQTNITLGAATTNTRFTLYSKAATDKTILLSNLRVYPNYDATRTNLIQPNPASAPWQRQHAGVQISARTRYVLPAESTSSPTGMVLTLPQAYVDSIPGNPSDRNLTVSYSGRQFRPVALGYDQNMNVIAVNRGTDGRAVTNYDTVYRQYPLSASQRGVSLYPFYNSPHYTVITFIPDTGEHPAWEMAPVYLKRSTSSAWSKAPQPGDTYPVPWSGTTLQIPYWQKCTSLYCDLNAGASTVNPLQAMNTDDQPDGLNRIHALSSPVTPPPVTAPQHASGLATTAASALPAGSYTVSFYARTASGTLDLLYGLGDAPTGATLPSGWRSVGLTPTWQRVQQSVTLGAASTKLLTVFEQTQNNPAWQLAGLSVKNSSGSELIANSDPSSTAWQGYGLKPATSPAGQRLLSADLSAGDGRSGLQLGGPLPAGRYRLSFKALQHGASPALNLNYSALENLNFSETLSQTERTVQRDIVLDRSNPWTLTLWETQLANPDWGLRDLSLRRLARLEERTLIAQVTPPPTPVVVPTTLTLGMGDGATMQFSKVDRSTLTNTDTDAGVPDWIFQYKTTPDTHLYRLEAKAGRSYSQDWIVLTKRSSGQTVAHYYSAGGSRTTFYGDGEWADFTQNLYEQNSNPVGDPDGIDSSVKTQITYEVQGLSSGRIKSVTDRWGRQTDYTYSGDLVSRIDYLKQTVGYVRSVIFGYSGTLLTGVTYSASSGVDSNNLDRSFTLEYDGNRIKTLKRPIGDGKTLTINYSTLNSTGVDTGRITKVTQTVGGVAYELEIVYAYNEEVSPLPNSTVVQVTQGDKRTKYIYDATTLTLIRKLERDYYASAGVDRDLTTSYSYDPNGSIGSVTTPAGAVLNFAYDKRGNRTLEKTSWGSKSRQTLSTYDRNNRLLSRTPTGSDGSAAPSSSTVYTQTTNGATTSSTTTLSGGALQNKTVTNYAPSTGLVQDTTLSWKSGGRDLSKQTTFGYSTGTDASYPVLNTTYTLLLGETARWEPRFSTANLSAKQYGDLVASSSTTFSDGSPTVSLSYVYDALGNPVKETQTGAFQGSSAPSLTPSFDTRSRITERAFTGYGQKTWEKVSDSSSKVTAQSWTRYHASGDPEVSWTGSGSNYTNFLYDTQGRLRKQDKLHGSIEYTYDPYGRVLTQRESNVANASITFSYDTLDRETARSMPDGVLLTRYHSSGTVSKTEDYPVIPAQPGAETLTQTPSKTVENTEIDALGRVTSSTVTGGGPSPSSYILSSEYDNLDHPTKVTNGALSMLTPGDAQATFMQYDAGGNLLKKLEPELGNNGSGVSQDRPLSVYQYDGLGQVTQEARLLEGTYSSGTYLTASTSTGKWAITSSTLNAVGKPSVVTGTRKDENGVLYSTTFTYDASGNLTSSKPRTLAATQFAYDASGRQTAMQDARGNPFYTVYDRLGNPTEKWEARCKDTTCTAASSKKLVQRYSYTYTDDGLLKEIKEPQTDGSGNMNSTETRSYTDGGRSVPTSISRLVGNQTATTTYQPGDYDYAGRVLKSTISGDSGSLEQRYDGHGNVVYTRTPEGFVTTTGYDAFDRILSKKEWTRTTTEGKKIDNDSSFADGGGLTYSYTYDRAGNLTEKLERGMKTTYTYGSLGNVVTESQTYQSDISFTPKMVATNSYRLDGSKISITNIAGNLTRYSLDPGGVVLEERSTDNGLMHHTAIYTNNERGQHLSRQFEGRYDIYADQRSDKGLALGHTRYVTLWRYDATGNLTEKCDTPGATVPVECSSLAAGLKQNYFSSTYSPTGKEIKQNREVIVRQQNNDSRNALYNAGGSNGLALAATQGINSALYNDRDLMSSSEVYDESPIVNGPDATQHSFVYKPYRVSTTYTYHASGAKNRTDVIRTDVMTNTSTPTSSQVTAYDVRGRPKAETGNQNGTVTTDYSADGRVTKTVNNSAGTQIYTESQTPTVGGLSATSSNSKDNIFGVVNSYTAKGLLNKSVLKSWQFGGCPPPSQASCVAVSTTTYTYSDTGKQKSSTSTSEFEGSSDPATHSTQAGPVNTYNSITDYLEKVTDAGANRTSTYTLDAFGNRLEVIESSPSGGGFAEKYNGFQKRYDADGRVVEFSRVRYYQEMFCVNICGDRGVVTQVNSFRYDPSGNQLIAAETSIIEQNASTKNTPDFNNYQLSRRFNNSLYINNELQTIRNRNGSFSNRGWCTSEYFPFTWQCYGYHNWGGSYESGANSRDSGNSYPSQTYNRSDLIKDQTYTLEQGWNDTVDFTGGSTAYIFNVAPPKEDKDLKPAEPATSTQIGVSIVNAGTPSSAQTPTDGSKEQAAAPSSDASTPDIGATVQGNGDLRPRDDSAAHAASSVASSAVEAASSAGSGDATSSVLGGTLDASKAAGAEGASSTTPSVPVENAQAPSSGTGIPNVSTPQDAKPDGSSGVNLPQIGVNGLEGAKAPVGFVEKEKGSSNEVRVLYNPDDCSRGPRRPECQSGPQPSNLPAEQAQNQDGQNNTTGGQGTDVPRAPGDPLPTPTQSPSTSSPDLPTGAAPIVQAPINSSLPFRADANRTLNFLDAIDGQNPGLALNLGSTIGNLTVLSGSNPFTTSTPLAFSVNFSTNVLNDNWIGDIASPAPVFIAGSGGVGNANNPYNVTFPRSAPGVFQGNFVYDPNIQNHSINDIVLDWWYNRGDPRRIYGANNQVTNYFRHNTDVIGVLNESRRTGLPNVKTIPFTSIETFLIAAAEADIIINAVGTYTSYAYPIAGTDFYRVSVYNSWNWETATRVPFSNNGLPLFDDPSKLIDPLFYDLMTPSLWAATNNGVGLGLNLLAQTAINGPAVLSAGKGTYFPDWGRNQVAFGGRMDVVFTWITK